MGPQPNGALMPVLNGSLSRLKPQSHSDRLLARETAEDTTSSVMAGSPERYESSDAG